MSASNGISALSLALINNAIHDVVSDDMELRYNAIDFFKNSPLYKLSLEVLGLPEDSLPVAFSDPDPLKDPFAKRIAYYCNADSVYKIRRVL